MLLLWDPATVTRLPRGRAGARSAAFASPGKAVGGRGRRAVGSGQRCAVSPSPRPPAGPRGPRGLMAAPRLLPQPARSVRSVAGRLAAGQHARLLPAGCPRGSAGRLARRLSVDVRDGSPRRGSSGHCLPWVVGTDGATGLPAELGRRGFRPPPVPPRFGSPPPPPPVPHGLQSLPDPGAPTLGSPTGFDSSQAWFPRGPSSARHGASHFRLPHFRFPTSGSPGCLLSSVPGANGSVGEHKPLEL